MGRGGRERPGCGSPNPTPRALLTDRTRAGNAPKASRFWATSGASKAVTSDQVPSSHAQRPHSGTEWLSARDQRRPLQRHGASFQVRAEGSAADRAHSLLQGPAGRALLPSCLLGRAPGGSGGIGPDGDVIPAPLEGESHVTGAVGGRGQRSPLQRPEGLCLAPHASPSPWGPGTQRGHPAPACAALPRLPAHPDAVVPALPLGIQGLHARSVTHGAPAQTAAALDFVGDDPDLEGRPAVLCWQHGGSGETRAGTQALTPERTSALHPPGTRPGPGAPRTRGTRCWTRAPSWSPAGSWV